MALFSCYHLLSELLIIFVLDSNKLYDLLNVYIFHFCFYNLTLFINFWPDEIIYDILYCVSLVLTLSSRGGGS